MPPEWLTSPTEFYEVSTRTSSEGAHIEDASKLQELYAFRDEVFVTRKVNFHWNLSDLVECAANVAQNAQPHANDG